ncbi:MULTISPECIES: WD40 repeat domain-containing protein [unclassified Streptomyces]|uniref:WD40 repeat domain-containing protein n=1 Tax=unclassified Streptomyces TaxID=2593676 RepID=UPI0033FFFD03
MRSLPLATGAAAVLLVLAAAVPVAAAEDPGFTVEDPRIVESSGLAASRAHPGVYWTHNDQDEPRVFAVDSRTGETVATVTLRGVGTPRDMEAVSVGPDGNVYVGDIGDNLDGSWDHVWIYRFPEPAQLRDQTVTATQFDVQYADGPRNAEALMVHPVTGRVYIASKREDGGGLYEGPETLTTGAVNVFRRIGEVPWVTDGAFSPDGRFLVLRSYFSARGYRWTDGGLGEDFRIRAPIQRQAESVSFTLDGEALMFGTEGGQSPVERVSFEAPGAEEGRTGGGSGASGGGDAAGPDGAPEPQGGPAVPAMLVLGGAALLILALRRRKG